MATQRQTIGENHPEGRKNRMRKYTNYTRCCCARNSRSSSIGADSRWLDLHDSVFKHSYKKMSECAYITMPVAVDALKTAVATASHRCLHQCALLIVAGNRQRGPFIIRARCAGWLRRILDTYVWNKIVDICKSENVGCKMLSDLHLRSC